MSNVVALSGIEFYCRLNSSGKDGLKAANESIKKAECGLTVQNIQILLSYDKKVAGVNITGRHIDEVTEAGVKLHGFLNSIETSNTVFNKVLI